MTGAPHSREIPLDLARAGEARHFVALRGAISGLGGGRLNELAVAAEAALTDVLLSAGEGQLEISAEDDRESLTIMISHPRIERRRMSDLDGILAHFLDGYEISPSRTVLVKRL